MRETETKLIDTQNIESKFIFNRDVTNLNTISDEEGNTLAFHRAENGNNIVFTTDAEGCAVAIEHCVDGSKIYHLSKDSKGLPAMHEFLHDGSEIMYLLDTNKELEKMIETKTNNDKISTWFYENEVITQEQRQNGGILFRIKNLNGEALIWLHVDGNIEAHGNTENITKLKEIFVTYLDGADV